MADDEAISAYSLARRGAVRLLRYARKDMGKGRTRNDMMSVVECGLRAV